MTAALVALAVMALLLGISLAPLLAEGRDEPGAGQADSDAASLEASRDAVVQGIRDVEFDHAMGKLTAEDRDRLRSELEGRAVRLLAAIDASEAGGRTPREPGA